MKLGFHVSISGSLDKAVDRAQELGCGTFQIFSRNPRSWKSKKLKEEDVEAFRMKLWSAGIYPVFIHMPYILNLASPNTEIYEKSIESLAIELKTCATLEVPFLVTHLGSHLGSGAEQGLARVVEAINNAMSGSDYPVTILLENDSGSGNKVGSSLEDLEIIIDRMEEPERVAVCFDTCHAFAAGYELRTTEGLNNTLAEIDATIGFERLILVHLNDSVGGLGHGIDHHEHIGLGEIGEDGFRLILHSRFANLPMIMETPVDDRRSDIENMNKALSLASM